MIWSQSRLSPKGRQLLRELTASLLYGEGYAPPSSMAGGPGLYAQSGKPGASAQQPAAQPVQFLFQLLDTFDKGEREREAG